MARTARTAAAATTTTKATTTSTPARTADTAQEGTVTETTTTSTPATFSPAALVAGRDTEAIVKAYRASDRSDMAAIRTALDEAMGAAVEALDIEAARWAKATKEACVASSGAASAKVEVDPRQATIKALAILAQAGRMVLGGTVDVPNVERPADMAPITRDEIDAYDITEADRERAVRLVKGLRVVKATVSHKVAPNVAAVAERYEVGQVVLVRTLAKDIAAHTEGEYEPGDGAIAAAITNGRGVPAGFVATKATTEGGPGVGIKRV